MLQKRHLLLLVLLVILVHLPARCEGQITSIDERLIRIEERQKAIGEKIDSLSANLRNMIDTKFDTLDENVARRFEDFKHFLYLIIVLIVGIGGSITALAGFALRRRVSSELIDKILMRIRKLEDYVRSK